MDVRRKGRKGKERRERGWKDREKLEDMGLLFIRYSNRLPLFQRGLSIR